MAALGEVKVFGARGGVAPRLLVNRDTFCDGRGVFFVAGSEQIRIWVAANTCAVQAGRAVPARRDRNLTGAARCRGCRGGPAWRGLGRRVIPRRWCFFLVLPDYASIVTWVLAMPSIGFAVMLVVLASGLRRGRLVALWLLAGAGRRDWAGLVLGHGRRASGAARRAGASAQAATVYRRVLGWTHWNGAMRPWSRLLTSACRAGRCE